MDNLSIASDINEHEILSLLARFGLDDKAKKFPYELSGGEKQRIAICRAILKKASVLLVDEPTGNLDEESARSILEFLKTLSKDKLIIMVTHDIEYAKEYSDYIYELKEGKFKEKPILSDIQEDLEIKVDSYKKIKLSFNHIKHFIINMFRIKWKKLIQYIFLFSVSFFMLGLGFSTLFTDEYSIAANALVDTGVEFYYIEADENTIYEEEDYQYWSDLLDGNLFKTYNKGVSKYFTKNDEYILNNNYNPFISSYIYDNEHIELVEGESPNADNEVLISDYLATCFIEQELVLGTEYFELINETIFGTDMIISGIYDTDFEQYQEMLNQEVYYKNNESFDDYEKSTFSYKYQFIYSTIYVDSSFDFTNTNHYLTFASIDSSNLLLSPRIYSYKDINETNLSEYNDEITKDNQIIISLQMLFEYLKDDHTYDFNTYNSFYSYWLSNEEELVNYVLGNTIVIYIEQTGNSLINVEEVRYYPLTYEISGVISDDSISSTAYISPERYNEMILHSYSLISYVGENMTDLANDIRTIRDNHYYYDSYLTNTILQYLEFHKNDMPLFTFSISGVFIIFSTVLFSALISKDIENKKKSIGLLRTLGISKEEILKLFLFEVLFITAFSLLIALCFIPLGISLLNVLTAGQMNSTLELIHYDIKMVMLLIAVGFIFSAISLIRPIIKLNRFQIVALIKKDN
jgi:putative ABC transport system permease protein